MTIELPVAEYVLEGGRDLNIAPGQESLANLAEHLRRNIASKIENLEQQGHSVTVLGPEWCRENPIEAGQLHADVIVQTYGSTYALPNKDPEANSRAIKEGGLDIYLMKLDDEVVGTTCLVDCGDGRAELGRSASIGKTGNTIIQDLRILDWICTPAMAERFHTLFATLRSAPDRTIDDTTGDFIMRGGQGVTAHWKKFPDLVINGFGPLYLKHGKLEQFSLATITRLEYSPSTELFLSDSAQGEFIRNWHEYYGLPLPVVQPIEPKAGQSPLKFTPHYPPKESGLTNLVHADIVIDQDNGVTVEEAVKIADEAGSPFIQVVLPIDIDSREAQQRLLNKGFQVFGYQPAYTTQAPALLFGKVLDGVAVVPTFWNFDGIDNPLWVKPELQTQSEKIASQWNTTN